MSERVKFIVYGDFNGAGDAMILGYRDSHFAARQLVLNYMDKGCPATSYFILEWRMVREHERGADRALFEG